MKIVTGYTGTTHVTADDDIFFNAGVISKNDYIFEIGNKFEAQIIDNNTIKILDGDMITQGVHCRIENGTYDTLNINNGQTGYKREDLIVVEYTKTLAGIQNTQLKVIQGESTTGTPETPTPTSGDILQGELLHQVPLYKINIDGLSITSIIPLFRTITNFDDIVSRLSVIEDKRQPLLFSGAVQSGNITLNDSLFNYKFLIMQIVSASGGVPWGTGLFPVQQEPPNNQTVTFQNTTTPNEHSTYMGRFIYSKTAPKVITVETVISNVIHPTGKPHGGATQYYMGQIWGVR